VLVTLRARDETAGDSTTTSIHLTGDPRRWASDTGAAGVAHFFGPYLYRSAFGSSTVEEERDRALAHLEQVILLEGPARDRETKEPLVPVGATGDANAPMAAFTKACLGRDVVPLVLGNRVHVAPPLNLSDADVDLAMSVLDEAPTEADAFVA
jgi:4-aminobutyrate aminotransferase-like enzyme